MFPLRDTFILPDPPEAIELRAFTHGLMPRTVPAMMQHFCDDWARFGVDAWNHVPNHWLPERAEDVGWWSLPEYLGDRFVAPLIGAASGTCIMQPNVHWSMQCLLSAPSVPARGRKVIVSESAFPSVLHSVQQWAALHQLHVEIIPTTTHGYVDQSEVLHAIDHATSLVMLSHVGFTSGEKLPDAFLQETAQRTQAEGGLFVIDGYHSIGSVPVDVQALGADIYVGGLLKEGCGSSGSCFIYLHPAVDLHPRLTGWFGDADPFAFNRAPASHPEVRRRFLGGTSSVASFYHAVEGARILLNVGLDAVRAYSLDLTEQAIEHIDRIGLPLHSPRTPERRSAMIILEAPAADRLCHVLKEHHIYTDSRQARYLRMAPFVWNTAEELHRTFAVLGDLLSSGSYRDVELDTADTGPVT